MRPLQSVEEYLLFFEKRQIINQRFVQSYKSVQEDLEIDFFDGSSSHFGLFSTDINKSIPLAFARLTERDPRHKVIPDTKPELIQRRCQENRLASPAIRALPIFEHFGIQDQDVQTAMEMNQPLQYVEAGRLLVTESNLPTRIITDFILYLFSIASHYSFDLLLSSVSESHSSFYTKFFGTNTIIRTTNDFSVPMVISVFDLKKSPKRKAELFEQFKAVFNQQGTSTTLSLTNSKILQ